MIRNDPEAATKILVVDDEPVQAGILGEILEHEGLDVTTRTQPQEALALAQRQSFDLVICDLKMPGMDGVELLQQLRKIHPDLTVIIMTAYGTIETAVNAMRHGAFDYVTKPFSKEELLITVQRAIKHLELRRENVYLKEELGLRAAASTLIGRSEAMQKIYKMMAKIAQDDKATVLIQGETGTGKELVARLIHQMSPRREAPFIAVNCAAIPDSIMESEFFGHKKGSFTGAFSDKDGLFQIASGGTLFLDEIAELPLHMQVKLLRAIQEKAVRPVGAQQEIPTDVRILSATHKNLGQLVESGQFRQDLYYRLNVIQLQVPGLRERRDDIPLLTEHFLKQLARRDSHAQYRIADDALQALSRYPFPGNVRELENILERATTLCEGLLITATDLQLPETETGINDLAAEIMPELEPGALPLDTYMDTIEKEALLKALEQTRYNKTAAARLLGLSFRALRYRLKKLGLE